MEELFARAQFIVSCSHKFASRNVHADELSRGGTARAAQMVTLLLYMIQYVPCLAEVVCTKYSPERSVSGP